MSAGSTVSPSGYSIRVVDRAVSLLHCYTLDQLELSRAQLADMVEISRPRTHCLLSSLAFYRFVEQNPKTKRD